MFRGEECTIIREKFSSVRGVFLRQEFKYTFATLYLPGEGWFQNARELAIPVIDVSAVLLPELR